MVSREVAETTVGKFEICGLKFVVSLKDSHDSGYPSLWFKKVFGLFFIPEKVENLGRGEGWQEISVWDLPYGTLRLLANHTKLQFLIDLNTPDEEGMVASLSQAEICIINYAVSQLVDCLWLHGACLVKDEKLLFFIAPSGGGKTTLSLAFLSQGFRLLTDDVIVIAKEDLSIQPFPRCPKIRMSALEQLSSFGYDVRQSAELLGRFIILPEKSWVKSAIEVIDMPKTFFILGSTNTLKNPLELDNTQLVIEWGRCSNFLYQDDNELSLVNKLMLNSKAYKLPVSDLKKNVEQIQTLSDIRSS